MQPHIYHSLKILDNIVVVVIHEENDANTGHCVYDHKHNEATDSVGVEC